MLSIKPCLHTQLPELPKSFPGVEAFDHLEWTYNGTFEQLFGLGRGKFSKNFPKIQMPGGLPRGGMLKLRFDWYISDGVVNGIGRNGNVLILPTPIPSSL